MALRSASFILAALLAIVATARHAPAGAVVARLGGEGPAVVDVAASPDGKTVATACADGDIRLWSTSGGASLGALAGGRVAIHCVAFSPDGATLAAGRRDGAVVLWDVRAAQVTRQIAAYTRDATAVAFSPDGRLLATGGPNGGIVIWEADGSELLRRMTAVAETRVRQALNEPVRGLTFSPDGALLVSTHGGFDPFVHVWDPLTGREVTRLAERGEGLSAAVFAPDGATLATASDGGEVITLWETATWRVRRRLDARGAAEFPGAISPDGRTLWSVTLGDVYQWDLASGRRSRQLSGEHHGQITAVTAVPATPYVVSASDDGTAVVWNGISASVDEKIKPAPADGPRLEGLWGSLAAEDAAGAYDAMWAMVAAPRESVPYLRNRLPREASADPLQIRRLLAQLDDELFTTRERATRELAAFGDAAEPLLREHLATTTSPEVSQRLETLLESIRAGAFDADTLRALRAVEILERIATPQARAALEELATGQAGTKLKARAQSALKRLDHTPTNRGTGDPPQVKTMSPAHPAPAPRTRASAASRAASPPPAPAAAATTGSRRPPAPRSGE